MTQWQTHDGKILGLIVAIAYINLRQVDHTLVPLSPGSSIWRRCKNLDGNGSIYNTACC